MLFANSAQPPPTDSYLPNDRVGTPQIRPHFNIILQLSHPARARQPMNDAMGMSESELSREFGVKSTFFDFNSTASASQSSVFGGSVWTPSIEG